MKSLMLAALILFLTCCVPLHLKKRLEGYDVQMHKIGTAIAQLRVRAAEAPSEALREDLLAQVDDLVQEQSRLSGAIQEAQAQVSEARAEQARVIATGAGEVVEGLAPIAGIFLPALAPILAGLGALTRRVASGRS
jgi:hypothetical protein